MLPPFRSLLFFSLLMGATASSAQPAPAWAAKFWNGINVSDLSRGCVQRARKLVENANNAAISPAVPQDVLSTLQLLVIFPHPTDGPEMVTHMGRSWYFHTVVTYEYQAERYVMDGGVPGQAVPYCDWILDITARWLSKYQVFLAKPDFKGILQDKDERLCSGCDASGRPIAPLHPVMLMPDEVISPRPNTNVDPIEEEPVVEADLPAIPDAPALRLALLAVAFRLLAHHALFGQSGGF